MEQEWLKQVMSMVKEMFEIPRTQCKHKAYIQAWDNEMKTPQDTHMHAGMWHGIRMSYTLEARNEPKYESGVQSSMDCRMMSVFSSRSTVS